MSSLKLKHSGGNSMSIEAPATNPASNLALKLPATIGSANQFVKNSGTAGTLGWSSVVEDSSGRVGIGVTDVSNYWEGGDQLVIKDTGTGGCGITIHADTDDESGIFFADGTTGNAKYEGYIQYDHSNNSMRLATTAVERFRIDSSGNKIMDSTFNVSSTSDRRSYFTSTGQQYHARNAHESMIVFQQLDGTGIGSIARGTTSTSYNTSSDYRLKENITALSDGITRLKTLKPLRFNFKSDKDTTVDGFLAHEVTAVPEAITGTKDQVATKDDEETGTKKGDPIYQGIDQSKLVPLLTAALQEAIAKIETLETKVAALEAG